ncbi:MAG: glycosyltransferase family 39 protein [Aquabacterium sp.]
MTQASSTTDKSGWPTALVALALLAWLACTAWMRPLAVPDEGRYAGVAWEMIRSGDWLTPTLNGLPFFHKPPLFYWLTALSIKAFGLTLWAARLASVLGALAGALAVHMLAKRWAGPRLAGWSTLVLVTQPFWFGGAQYANLDMLVAGCISAAIAFAAHAVLAREAGRPFRLALYGAYAFAGLGLLAKGLIGLVLPGAVIVVWLLLGGRWRAVLGLLSLPGMAVLAVVAAPWFVAMQRLYPDFFHYFFVYQHFQRFTQTGFNNMHAWWYYLPLIVGLSLPWVPAWMAAVCWPGKAPRVSDAASAPPDSGQALRLLMWVWMGVIVVFFSIPASKLPGYVLPALPPLAWLVADALLCRWPRGAWGLPALAGLAAVLCVGLIAVAVQVRQAVDPAPRCPCCSRCSSRACRWSMSTASSTTCLSTWGSRRTHPHGQRLGRPHAAPARQRPQGAVRRGRVQPRAGKAGARVQGRLDALAVTHPRPGRDGAARCDAALPRVGLATAREKVQAVVAVEVLDRDDLLAKGLHCQ